MFQQFQFMMLNICFVNMTKIHSLLWQNSNSTQRVRLPKLTSGCVGRLFPLEESMLLNSLLIIHQKVKYVINLLSYLPCEGSSDVASAACWLCVACLDIQSFIEIILIVLSCLRQFKSFHCILAGQVSHQNGHKQPAAACGWCNPTTSIFPQPSA